MPDDRDRPMSPDEVLHLENRRAEQEEPEELARLAAAGRVELSAMDGDLDEEVLRKAIVRDEDGAVRLELPPDVVVGRVGRTAERLPLEEARRLDDATLEPHVPPWADRVYHPKVVPARRPTLRRRSGRRIEPHYGVYGADDRSVFWPGGYPWRCVGKVFAWTNPSGSPAWSGSGVLVGERLVLTAGHVCPWGSTPWMMQFVPGFWDGVSVNGAGVRSWVSDYRGWDTDGDVAGNDMAILRLYTPLGSTMGWFGMKTYHDSWEDGPYWTLAGYPGMVSGGSRPSRQSGIPVLDDDGGPAGTVEIEHHGDSSPGVSGGPFFSWWDGKPYVIGTASGGESFWSPFGIGNEDNNVAAGGAGMVRLIKWGRQNWPV